MFLCRVFVRIFRSVNPRLQEMIPRLPSHRDAASLLVPMQRLIATPFRLTALMLGVALFWVSAPRADAQTSSPPLQPSQFDPSDVYFQGYLATRAAEDLEAKGDHVGALEKLRSARKMLDAIAQFYPEWKPEMLQTRTRKNNETIARIEPLATEKLNKDRRAIAELEGGAQVSGNLIDPTQGVTPLTPGILQVDPLQARRLADARAEVERLREQLNRNPANANEASRNASRVEDIAKQRDSANAQLQAAEAKLETLRSRMASQPVASEVTALNQKIQTLEQERRAMSAALEQSRGSHQDAKERSDALETELAKMRQQYADLDRDLKAERNVANAVVAGQRSQLQTLEKELAEKSAALNQANQKITQLITELDQSREAFGQLRQEHDALLLERDQMSALLKLNEEGRIQQLVEQNIGLAKDLRESSEKLDSLNRDNNATKDDLALAMRNMAIAKSQINRLHQEKREQDQRIEEYKAQLKREEDHLVQGKSAVSAAEVEVLRDIIKRQQLVQKRRLQARDLLVKAVKNLSQENEPLAQAMKLFDGLEIEMSPEEQRLLASRDVDGEFISPFAQDRETVGRNTRELNRDIAVFERTADKAFLTGRFAPARELMQMVVEENPGRTSAMCKLGVIHLKLEDPISAIDMFRRATEMERDNPFAHRMLGFAQMSIGEYPPAEEALRRAIELNPSDALSYTLLATLSYRMGRLGDAEQFYKSSIAADPMLSEPYFNLALLCANDRRLEEARSYYQQALERGAMPDTALEEKIHQP